MLGVRLAPVSDKPLGGETWDEGPEVNAKYRPRDAGKRSRAHKADKLSARLVELISPYEPYCETLAAFEHLAALGSAAWNLAALPEKVRGETMAKILEAVPLEDRDTASRVVQELLISKLQLYPEDRRLIMGVHVVEEAESFHVTVASAG